MTLLGVMGPGTPLISWMLGWGGDILSKVDPGRWSHHNCEGLWEMVASSVLVDPGKEYYHQPQRIVESNDIVGHGEF